MIAPDDLLALVAVHGLPVAGLIAVVEGPIITVLCAWAAAGGLFTPWKVFAVMVLADLIGDIAFYALGRQGVDRIPAGWLRRIGARPGRLRGLERQFRHRGGRMLALGKVTHSAGALFLLAAGAARMPVLPFLWFNLLATLPKTALFFALGWFGGHAWQRMEIWIANGSILLALVVVATALWWFLHQRRTSPASSRPITRRPGSRPS